MVRNLIRPDIKILSKKRKKKHKNYFKKTKFNIFKSKKSILT